MRYVVKDLRETYGVKPRHEIHLEGCKHLSHNSLQNSHVFTEETTREVVVRDNIGFYATPEELEDIIPDYKIAPCAK